MNNPRARRHEQQTSAAIRTECVAVAVRMYQPHGWRRHLKVEKRLIAVVFLDSIRDKRGIILTAPLKKITVPF